MNDTIESIVARTAPEALVDHALTDDKAAAGVIFEKRPATTLDGTTAEGLYNAWITLDNPSQYNSYTTEMVKGVNPRLRPGLHLPRCQRSGIHRYRRQGFLYRRQHKGVRRVLRR